MDMRIIGDSAACINPLNGEGIDYALETGRLAAEQGEILALPGGRHVVGAQDFGHQPDRRDGRLEFVGDDGQELGAIAHGASFAAQRAPGETPFRFGTWLRTALDPTLGARLFTRLARAETTGDLTHQVARVLRAGHRGHHHRQCAGVL